MISDNINNIEQKINSITRNSGLKIKIIAVSKNQPLNKIKQAIGAGLTSFGENYIQEAKVKFSTLPEKIEKHFIGHLQTNKVKDAVKIFDVIQTVDSIKLAKEIDKQAKKAGLEKFEIFLQINISGDPDKYGLKENEIHKIVKEIAKLQNIRITGLMTILKFDLSKKETRTEYKKMKKLFDEIKAQKIPNTDFKYLSMGMSDDYEIAIEEGSNMVRIGTKIFGARN